MVISDKYKYLFVEVPHTASTAISQELCTHYDGRTILRKHANYSEFLKQASSEEKKYFTFAAVRNPLDAIVTDYMKLKTNKDDEYTNPDEWQINGGWIPEEHLDKFRFIHAQDPEVAFENFFRKYYSRGYTQWVLILHKKFNYVMHYESIADEFEKVLGMIGIDPVQRLPVVNKTNRNRDFLSLYTPAIRPDAAKICGPFMKQWSYDFPENWGDVKIPSSSLLYYNLIDSCVNTAGRFITLAPKKGYIQNIKKVTYNISSKLGRN